ncbi:ATP-grasp domain-containing protein [Candidatus Nitrotoga sp. M5]|uniref:ATP-grasp domain-containing protein n=1 Tax=Candidatus Nitrotoga sp. M5 TaxID=2890409 RepID=UPI001EF315D5|nr:ATP-grasp domain-containing protein [Candidatus Nitrotoga sp. M5]CAH1385735.1 Phosphoribosylglycinamide synthetase, ATP-grasp (A) domain protein [Candidatus Nitrotoga sp. M5]
MKKILFLGAAPTQVSPIQYALEQGHRVFTCDYLPENPGHRLAHESFIVSTTDKEAVLELAKRLKIDGIVAYASDPAAPTAAFVAEQMGLPGNPYQSVLTLTRKDLFRTFLKKHGFNVPRSQSFYVREEARVWLNKIGMPAFIKPVDSSGSKGVTRLTDLAKFDEAFDCSLVYSREKMVVIEEQIIRSHHQIAGDGFILNGELIFWCWADEHFDKLCNGLVPIGESFPTQHPNYLLAIAQAESQRLLTLLGMKTGALNFDFVFTEDGRLFFLELGPRNGGCLIPEVIRYATGMDLIKCTVDAALGLPCSEFKINNVEGFWSSYMLHSLEDGVFQELWISDRLMRKIVEQDIWVKTGDKVEKYFGSNQILGTMILRFESMLEMTEMMDNMEQDIQVIVQ